MKKIILLMIFIISPSAFAVDLYCGPNYNDYKFVKGRGNPDWQSPGLKFSYPTPVIPLETAVVDGVSLNVPLTCGVVSDSAIDGWKDGGFANTWTPHIQGIDINKKYIASIVQRGQFQGDGRMTNFGNLCDDEHRPSQFPNAAVCLIHYARHTITFPNQRIKPTIFRFRSDVKSIPANTHLFAYYAEARLNLDDSRDATIKLKIGISTDRTYYIEKPTCDFSSDNVYLTLDDYERNTNTRKLVPLTITCNFDYSYDIKLTGNHSSSDSSIFLNTASTDRAQGVGFRFTDLKGNIIKANQPVKYSSGYRETINLFYVDYARTGEKLRAGNAQSVVNVEIKYD